MFLQGAKFAASEKLLKYFKKCNNPTYLCATVLDPRVKTTFWDEDRPTNPLMEPSMSTIKAVWERDYKQNLPPIPKIPRSAFSFASIASKKNDDELDQYLAAPTTPILDENDVSGAYTDWKNMFKHFPNLGKMAMKYLGVPITAVSAERLFSSARHMMPYTRCSQTIESYRQAVLLRAWYKYFCQ